MNTRALLAIAVAVAVGAAAVSAAPGDACTGLEPEECGPFEYCDDELCFCDLEIGFRCGDGSCINRELVGDGYCDCNSIDDCLDEADGPVGGDDDDDAEDGDDGEHGDEDDHDDDSPFDTDSGDSSSSGDPHFRTLDGLYYDYQGLGEHVYCQTPDLSIHTCHAPWVYNPTMTAVNRAVSVNYGATTITAEYNEAVSAFLFFHNGELMTTDTTLATADLTVTPGTNSIAIVTAGGDRVVLRGDVWAQWINIELRPAPGAETRGLCGTNNGEHRDDFTLPDGSVVPIGHPWYSINSRADYFGSMWRVDSIASLMPPAVTCPATADGYEKFDLLEVVGEIFRDGVEPHAAKGAPRRGPAALRAAFTEALNAHRSRAAKAMASAPSDISDVANEDNFFAAASCLAQYLDIELFELEDLIYRGDAHSVRLTQVLYDLMFFTFANDAPDTVPIDSCSGGHRVIDALLAPVDDTPVDDTDEFVARCDGDGSCESATARSRGTRVTLSWSDDGEC